MRTDCGSLFRTAPSLFLAFVLADSGSRFLATVTKLKACLLAAALSARPSVVCQELAVRMHSSLHTAAE